jgi:hypothetical protein
VTAALTAGERLDLAALEIVVREGLATFIEVGQALAEIRDRRLYRQTHGTFEEYCHEKWLLSRTRAYQLMDAAVVSTVVDNAGLPSPANEAQSRELAPLKDDEAEVVAVWREATAEAEELGTSLTAKVVRNAVRKRLKRVQRERQIGEARERHMASRCDGCGRTPRELEGAGVGMSSGWFYRNGGRGLCSDCHRARIGRERERQEREECALAERLGKDGYRELQEDRAREKRREHASRQLRYVRDMLTGGEHGPEQSLILEFGRWRDELDELSRDDLDPNEAQALDAVLAEAEQLVTEIRSLLRANAATLNGGVS